MTSEVRTVPETVREPDKVPIHENRVLTLEKRLPGPFAALQHTYGPVPREFVKNASQYGEGHVRWTAMRHMDANRNPLFKASTSYSPGLDGYYIEFPPEEALRRIVGTGRGLYRAVDHLNDQNWGTTDRLIKTLKGELFDPNSVILADTLFSETKARLQSSSSQRVKQFRKETADYVAQFPNAGIAFTKDAAGNIISNTLTVPVFTETPHIYERLTVTPDVLTPEELYYLQFLVTLCQVTQPLCRAMVNHGALSDEVKDAIRPKLFCIDDVPGYAPRLFVNLPSEAPTEHPPAMATIEPSFYGKPPAVKYEVNTENQQVPYMTAWQQHCLARYTVGNKPHSTGISAIYTPGIVYNKITQTMDIVPQYANGGAYIMRDDFARDLATQVLLQKERYLQENQKKEISPLVSQLKSAQTQGVRTIMYDGKTFPIGTDAEIITLASQIPPYTAITEISATNEPHRTLAAVSGGWYDPNKTPLYIGEKWELGAESRPVTTHTFTAKPKNINLPTHISKKKQ